MNIFYALRRLKTSCLCLAFCLLAPVLAFAEPLPRPSAGFLTILESYRLRLTREELTLLQRCLSDQSRYLDRLSHDAGGYDFLCETRIFQKLEQRRDEITRNHSELMSIPLAIMVNDELSDFAKSAGYQEFVGAMDWFPGLPIQILHKDEIRRAIDQVHLESRSVANELVIIRIKKFETDATSNAIAFEFVAPRTQEPLLEATLAFQPFCLKNNTCLFKDRFDLAGFRDLILAAVEKLHQKSPCNRFLGL